MLGRWGPNYGGKVFRWSSFIIVSNNPGYQLRWPPLLKKYKNGKNHLKIICPENARQNEPKLW